MFQCPCGVKLNHPQMPVYCHCGRIHRGDTVAPGRPPRWVRILTRLRKPGELGPGDTFARLLGQSGERFKAWSAKLGVPCNCTRRQAEWNERWPYA